MSRDEWDEPNFLDALVELEREIDDELEQLDDDLDDEEVYP